MLIFYCNDVQLLDATRNSLIKVSSVFNDAIVVALISLFLPNHTDNLSTISKLISSTQPSQIIASQFTTQPSPLSLIVTQPSPITSSLIVTHHITTGHYSALTHHIITDCHSAITIISDYHSQPSPITSPITLSLIITQPSPITSHLIVTQPSHKDSRTSVLLEHSHAKPMNSSNTANKCMNTVESLKSKILKINFESIIMGERLSDIKINVAQRMTRIQFSSIKGLKSTL